MPRKKKKEKPVEVKLCEYCGEPLNDRRQRMHDNCKTNAKYEKKEKEKWAVTNNEAPPPVEEKPQQKEPNTYSLKALEMEEASSLGIDYSKFTSFPEPEIEMEEPSVFTEIEESSQEEELTKSPEQTFTKAMNDPKIWVPGQSWLDVFVFNGDFDLDFNGDLESDRWVPALQRIWEKIPIDRLKQRLKNEYGGGAFQIRFFQSGTRKAKKVRPDIILRIPGEETMPLIGRQQNQIDPNAIILEKERQAESAKQEARRLQEEQVRSQIQANNQAFELQKQIVQNAEKREAELRSELNDLRSKGGNSEAVKTLEKMLDIMREEKKFMMLQLEELRKESTEKDQNLFQWMLKQQEKNESARLSEQQKFAENQTKLAQIMSERDEKFLEAISSMNSRDDGSADSEEKLMKFFMFQQQQQQKSMEMFMMQMQNQNQRFEEFQRESKKDMLMLIDGVFKSKDNGHNDRGTDKFEAFLLSQQQQVNQQLQEERMQNARLMEKMIDQASQSKTVNSMQEFINTATTFQQAKDVLGGVLGVATGQPEVEKEAEDFFGKIEKVANAFKLGDLTSAIGNRINNGQNRPLEMRPPATIPMAGNLPPQQPVAGVLPQGQPVGTTSPPQMPHQPAPAPSPAPAPAPAPKPPSNLSEDAKQLIDMVEEAIKSNAPPKDIFSVLPSSAINKIQQQLTKNEFVDMIQSSAVGKPMIQSVRGKKWLMVARDLLYP